MAHKLDSSFQEEEQLEVGSLERGEVLGAHASIQITRLDTRELGQIVHHLLTEIMWDGREESE